LASAEQQRHEARRRKRCRRAVRLVRGAEEQEVEARAELGAGRGGAAGGNGAVRRVGEDVAVEARDEVEQQRAHLE
jgi:hypothetical protein